MYFPIWTLKHLSPKTSAITVSLVFIFKLYFLYQLSLSFKVLYEDLSDVAQINEKIRTSKLDAISPIAARIIHLH